MGSGTAPAGPEIRFRVWPALAAGGPVAGALLGFAGLYVDALGSARNIVGAVAIVMLGAGFLGNRKLTGLARRVEVERARLAKELERVRAEFGPLDAESVLRALARVLFAAGRAWRLTVYFVEDDDQDVWYLRRILRVASSPRWEKGGRERFPTDESYLRQLDSSDLTDPTTPFFGESGEFPDPDEHYEDWLALQIRVLRDEALARGLRMRPQKYAWCATRETDGQRRIIVLMAESCAPQGVRTEALRSSLVPSMLALIARACDAPMVIDRVSTLSGKAARLAPPAI